MQTKGVKWNQVPVRHNQWHNDGEHKTGKKRTAPPDCVMTQIIFTFRHHQQNSKIARLNYVRSCVPFVKVQTPDLSMLWPLQSNSHFAIFWTCRVMHGVLHERCDAPRLNTRQKKSRAAKKNVAARLPHRAMVLPMTIAVHRHFIEQIVAFIFAIFERRKPFVRAAQVPCQLFLLRIILGIWCTN